MRLTLYLAALVLVIWGTMEGADDDARRAGLLPESDVVPAAVAEAPAPAQPAPVQAVAISAAEPVPAPEPVAVAAAVPVSAPAPEAVAEVVPTEMPAAVPAESTAPEVATVPEPDPIDIRTVATEALNVRDGPSTGFGVIGRLSEGEQVRVVAEDPSGWVRIVIEGDGVEGWVAARLLRPAD